MCLFQLPTNNKNSPRWDITKDQLPFTNPANIYFFYIEDMKVNDIIPLQPGRYTKKNLSKQIHPGYQDTATVAKNLKNNTVWVSSDLGLDGINKNKDKKNYAAFRKKTLPMVPN